MQTTTNHGYALLIGVNDYAAYDASRDQPKGTSDLPGSVNDVRAWWALCSALGFRPENVRVLASPGIHGEKLPGAGEHTMGEATEKGILDGVKWLTEKLGGDATAIGLLTYSGHGDFVEQKGLVVCPTNVTGKDLQHSIPFVDLRAAIDAAHAGANLTVVLDCCHSGGGGSASRKGLSLTGRPVPKAILDDVKEISGRVYSAAPRDGLAYQAEFAGRYHGALTWALTSTLEQWKAVQQGDSLRLTVSYGESLRRTQALLSALSFKQTPGLHGGANVADLAVFQSGSDPQPTSPDPDVSPMPMQLDPGMFNGAPNGDYRVYQLTLASSTVLAKIMATGATPPTGYLANTEYYWVLTNLNGSSRVTVTAADYAPSTTAGIPSGVASFSWNENAAWSSGAPANNATTFVYSAGNWALAWGLTLRGSAVTGTITWYNNSASKLFGGNASTINFAAGNNMAAPTPVNSKCGITV
jgi:hypothetical protein